MATAKIEEYQGIVLSRIPQKEHDAMVRVLGERGLFSFYARGALKVGGANNFLTQELSLAHFNLIVSASGALTLRDGKMETLLSPKSGLEGMLSASFCLEYCLRALNEEDAVEGYSVLLEALRALEGGADPYSVDIMFLAAMLKLSGNGLEVDHCVICGSKNNIVTLDVTHGGFVCADCLNLSLSTPLSATELKVYRHAFRCPLSDFSRVTYPKDAKESVLASLVHDAQEQTGIRLRSLETILKY